MTVSLPPEQERYTRELVESGQFESVDDVLSTSLRLLEEQETAWLREKIDEAFESGPPIRITREELRAKMGQRMAELRGEVERGERPPPGGPGSIPV